MTKVKYRKDKENAKKTFLYIYDVARLIQFQIYFSIFKGSRVHKQEIKFSVTKIM